LLKILQNRKDIYQHSLETAKYACILARALNLPTQEFTHVVLGGLFHDLGKTQIKPELLSSKILNEADWEIIKNHPLWSYEMVLCSGLDPEIAQLVYYHHERIDGQGYPEGKSGIDIPFGAKIISLADSFSAMTMYRNYAGCKSITGALQELNIHAGTQFDSNLVKVMNNLFEEKPWEILASLAI